MNNEISKVAMRKIHLFRVMILKTSCLSFKSRPFPLLVFIALAPRFKLFSKILELINEVDKHDIDKRSCD